MSVELLPVKNDYVFAKLFGSESHKRVLVCLLNAILNGQPHIKSIALDPTEYKKCSKDGKSVRLDIAATTDDGTRVNVEIQCKDTGDIVERMDFYDGKRLQDELREGESYGSIPNIITIWICGSSVTKRKGCVNEIVDMYKNNGIDPVEIASEKMRKFIIELTKLENTPKRFCNDMFTVWMQLINDPNNVPEEFLRIPEVKEAMDELSVMSMDKATRAEYEARVKEINDFHAGNTTSFNKGREEGLAEGREEGAHKKAIETATNLLKMGLSVEQVSQATGLSVEEVKGGCR